jgi:cytochrome c
MRAARLALLSAAIIACGGKAPSATSTPTNRGVVQSEAALPTTLSLGATPTEAEIAAMDIDVNTKGEGLPAGRGTHEEGIAVYQTHCASCHGVGGLGGIAPNPALVGREPRDFSFATKPGQTKTVGNYWPHATTLYDYIRRAMPQTAPGSLSASDTYAVIAYILAENEIIAKDAVMDAKTLPAVVMPARDRFVRDNRTGGAGFR